MAEKYFSKVVELVTFLRSKEGCPWDQEQTLHSLAPIILEEVYEVVEALEQNDLDALKEELGDLLWDLIFIAEIASGQGKFSITDVCQDLAQKIVRRHPHIWGSKKTRNMDEIGELYDVVKKNDYRGKRTSPFDGIVKHQPALTRALKVVKKAQKAKVSLHESPEVEILVQGFDQEMWGALLFQLTIQARNQKIDLESALRSFTTQYIREQKITSEKKKK